MSKHIFKIISMLVPHHYSVEYAMN